MNRQGGTQQELIHEAWEQKLDYISQLYSITSL